MEDAADKPDQRQQQLASQIDAAPSSSIWNIDNDGPEVTPTELGAALDKPMDDEAAKHQLPHQAERVKAVMDDVDGVAGPLKPQTDDQPGDAAEVATEQDVAGAQKRAAPHPESSIVDEPHEDKLVLESFVLYKTESKFYVVGSNQADSRYRVLKIDRHYDPADHIHELHVTEDATIYTKNEVADLLQMIDVGNKHAGGLQKVAHFYGILGFVRFTGSWYMITIRARAPVALIGGHYVYHCEDSTMTAITDNVKVARPAEENRLLAAFQQVDLSKNFYFSYSYDLTNTLQTNFTKTAFRKLGKSGAVSTQLPPHMHWTAQQAFHEASEHDLNAASAQQPEIPVADGMAWGFNDRFIWNHFLLQPAFGGTMTQTDKRSCWVLPLIHGFVDQAKLSVYGRIVYVTLVARRSRHFAGARFLKRGVNDEGNVANDVESEQIVSEALTTTFYSYSNKTRQPVPRYTSFVQHRGSIPLSWQQDTSTSSLKPPIHLHLVDPYHAAAALHFDDLFARYGAPVTCLNLVKGKEREPRESKLTKPFEECISYLNQFLPETKKIKYTALDMSSAYRNKNTNVIEVLEEIAGDVLQDTSFFHSGATPVTSESLAGTPDHSRRSLPQLQRGVCRTNCIDCLDRTNAAQFVIAKAAMGHQLHALGILAEPDLKYDTDAADILTEMYHDHGDTIALQYGGSHLVNTMNTYRKINQWKSHSRDMIEGLKRFYANVALDQEKQNSINIFLGIASAPTSQQQQMTSLPVPTIALGTLSPASAISAMPSAGSTQGSHTAGTPVSSNAQLARSTEDLSKSIEKSIDSTSIDDDHPDALMPLRVRRDYRHWFTPEYLDKIPSVDEAARYMRESELEEGNIWTEYYRTKLFTQFERHFAIRINSTTRYSAHIPRDVSEKNLSPFKVRQPPPKPHWARSGKTHRVASGAAAHDTAAVPPDGSQHGDSDDDAAIPSSTDGLARRLLKPKVQSSEAMEYRCYVEQYRNLNLSNELLFESSEGDLRMYERVTSLAAGGRNVLDSLSTDPASLEAFDKHCKVMLPWQEVI